MFLETINKTLPIKVTKLALLRHYTGGHCDFQHCVNGHVHCGSLVLNLSDLTSKFMLVSNSLSQWFSFTVLWLFLKV